MVQGKIKEILLARSPKHNVWSINVSFIFINFYGPVVKEKQFLRSCPKPIRIKSFPCWILEQFLIWDDKNNLSWQMAQCCHPLCCLELNELCISTTTLLSLFERAVDCQVCRVFWVLKWPWTLAWWPSNAGRQTGHTVWIWGDSRLCFLTYTHHVSAAWNNICFSFMSTKAQRRALLHVSLTTGPQLEGAQDCGRKKHGESQACETFRLEWHHSHSHSLPKASHMYIPNFNGVGKWNPIMWLEGKAEWISMNSHEDSHCQSRRSHEGRDMMPPCVPRSNSGMLTKPPSISQPQKAMKCKLKWCTAFLEQLN